MHSINLYAATLIYSPLFPFKESSNNLGIYKMSSTISYESKFILSTWSNCSYLDLKIVICSPAFANYLSFLVKVLRKTESFNSFSSEFLVIFPDYAISKSPKANKAPCF